MRLNIVDPYLPKLTLLKKIHKSLKSGLVTNNSRNLVLFEKELKNFLKVNMCQLYFVMERWHFIALYMLGRLS